MISNTDLRSGPYLTDGNNTTFAITFQYFLDTEIAVYQVTIADGTTVLLILGVDYTITDSGSGLQEPFDSGTVTTSAALAAGFKIVILRNMALTQNIDITNQGFYYQEVITQALDRAAMVALMQAELLSRATLGSLNNI
jgi:hypothetical protein